MTCEKHGEYEAKEMKFGSADKPRYTSCPKCSEELREQREREHLDLIRIEKMQKYLKTSGIPLRFKFKRLEGLEYKRPEQKTILKAVTNYLKAIMDRKNPSLILCGKPGTGKTHIGCALVMSVIMAGFEAQIVTTANMLRRVKSTWSREAVEDEEFVLYEFGRIPFFVIDEVGVQFGTETEKMIFHEIIDRRYNNMLPTVLISNLPADELSAFIGERAFDRFREDGGAILAFDWESHRGQK